MPSAIHESLRLYVLALDQANRSNSKPQQEEAIRQRKKLLTITRESQKNSPTTETNFVLGMLLVEDDNASQEDLDYAVTCLADSYEGGDIEAGIALHMIAQNDYITIPPQKAWHVNLDDVLQKGLAINHPHAHYLKVCELINIIPSDLIDPSVDEHYKQMQVYLEHMKRAGYVGADHIEAYLFRFGPGAKSSVIAAKIWERAIANAQISNIFSNRIII